VTNTSKQRITPSGPRYQLFCNVQTHRKDIKVDTQPNFIACVDACGALPGCLGVDFSKPDKQCYYKSEAMTEFTDGAANNDVDSAGIVWPACDPSAVCPAVDNQICTINNVPVQYFCGKGTWATNLSSAAGTSLADCAAQCVNIPNCQGVDVSAGMCYFKSQWINPPATVNAAVNCMVPVSQRS
jgi:hypothetical protein